MPQHSFGSDRIPKHTHSAPVAHAVGYNRAVRSRRARRPAIVTLLALVVLGLLLAHAPFGLGAVRLRGVSVVWWYVALAAPLTVTVVAVAGLLISRE